MFSIFDSHFILFPYLSVFVFFNAVSTRFLIALLAYLHLIILYTYMGTYVILQLFITSLYHSFALDRYLIHGDIKYSPRTRARLKLHYAGLKADYSDDQH